MKINSLTLKDRKLFAGYLGLARHELSTYAFQNIYIWKGIFQIKWALIRDSLCVFFRDRIGTFMYLPPLAKEINPAALEECLSFMDSQNQNREVSRIENICARDIREYKKMGYGFYQKPGEYLYKRNRLAELKGNPYKSKRADVNYFLRNYKFAYR
ncbi:MAG: phosphatidylglycerol lysyltransferase domain-containing protein, partial [Candidatus Omnitrophota bacterium]|nr:phosphatidylglycerol lysyltransferase domain-containing protein [Candidatus Omnitrophota bacterium]